MNKPASNHPAPASAAATVAWRSAEQLEEHAGARQRQQHEYSAAAAALADAADAEVSRRSFLKLMGASSALAGLGMAACRRPESYIVPYTRAPEWVVPGKATYYATSMPRAHGATPLVVTSFEGRPTQVAPNRLHPDADGTDAFAQASILDLYSPSRSRQFLMAGSRAARADFEALLTSLATNKSAKIGFLFGADDCPTRARLRGELAAKFTAAKFYQYEALATGAAAAALGDGVKWHAEFAAAERILTLDCDFIGTDPQGPVAAFFARRKPEGKDYDAKPEVSNMNRLYAVEAAYTLTGGMADHRLRVAPSHVLTVAGQIARGLVSQAGLVSQIEPVTDRKQLAWVDGVIKDLKDNAGKSLVLAGSRQPAAVHHLVLAINLALGNLGAGKPLSALQTDHAGLGTLAGLIADIDAGAVETLVMVTPANPIYDAPADFQLGECFAKLKTSIHLGMRTDATAHAAGWHVPAAHYLESWADARSSGGTYTVVQPMILPLYPDCVTELELLLALLSEDGKLRNGEGPKGEASPAYDAVRATFAALAGAGEEAWKNLLRQGYYAGQTYPQVLPQVTPAALAAAVAAAKVPAPSAGALEIVFATDASVHDGRWIDNGWLQRRTRYPNSPGTMRRSSPR